MRSNDPGINVWEAMAAAQKEQGGEPFDLTGNILLDDSRGEVLPSVTNLNGDDKGNSFF